VSVGVNERSESGNNTAFQTQFGSSTVWKKSSMKLISYRYDIDDVKKCLSPIYALFWDQPFQLCDRVCSNKTGFHFAKEN